MSRTVKVRLNEKEEALLNKKAKASGKSKSEIFRSSLYENTIACTIVYSALQAIDGCIQKNDLQNARKECMKLCQIMAYM